MELSFALKLTYCWLPHCNRGIFEGISLHLYDLRMSLRDECSGGFTWYARNRCPTLIGNSVCNLMPLSALAVFSSPPSYAAFI
ncbi:MAG: hypothetical protein LBF43_04090 [Puniceicoccales bacterium]|nr:hypothetical protein [Puniceicoccales bacterium]